MSDTAKFSMGALPSPKDERDYQFTDIAGAATAKVIPYHSDVPDIIVNQLASSQCGPCAITAARYETENLQNGNTQPLSHTWVYGHDDECTLEGMYMRTLMKIACQGIPYATNWESWGNKSYCRSLCNAHNTEEIREEARKLRSSSYYVCNSWADVCNATRVTNGGVVIMVQVYNNWYHVNSTGIVGVNSGQFYGYHFLRVKDYEILNDGKTYKIRCQNSWGEDWGDGGYCYLFSSLNGFIEARAVVDDINEVVRKLKFTDVSEDRWSYDAINWCAENGIISGFDDGSFQPESPATREQIASMLYRFSQHMNS